MSIPDYLRRVGLMVLGAMPCTVVAITLLEMRHPSARVQGIPQVIGGAVFMVYVWGILTGILVSVLHTFALNSFSQGVLLASLFLGGVIGAAGGALTPTAFTGLLNPATIGWGFFTGVVYAAITWIVLGGRGAAG